MVRRTLVGQLLYNVIVEFGSAAKETIEEGGSGREDVDTDGNVNYNELPALDDDSGIKYTQRYLYCHHRQNVHGFRHNDPLLLSIERIPTQIRTSYLGKQLQMGYTVDMSAATIRFDVKCGCAVYCVHHL